MFRFRTSLFTAVLFASCALYVCAPAAATDKPPIGAKVAGARSLSKVLGVVWNADSTPVPGAKVRLRNLQTGRIEATTVANQLGQFVFENLENGSYVIELVDDNGKVRAVGQSFRINSGETIATFVRLAARAPWFTGFFTNAAAVAVAVASSAGVMAVGSDSEPVSPR